MPETTPTAIRFTEDDLAVIRQLEKLTGLTGPTAIIRLALRSALFEWDPRARPKKGGK
jgi:hypothetical protein